MFVLNNFPDLIHFRRGLRCTFRDLLLDHGWILVKRNDASRETDQDKRTRISNAAAYPFF